jgi:hypothetical protein
MRSGQRKAHRFLESKLMTSITAQTLRSAERRAKLLILAAAGLSFLFSVSLWFAGLRDEGLFVGIWVPSILALGGLLLAGRGRES